MWWQSSDLNPLACPGLGMTKHQSGCCCPQEGASFLPVFPHMALPEAQVWDPETEMKSTTLTAWEKQGAGPTLDLPIHTCAPPLLVPLESPSPTQHRTWPFSEDCGNIGKRHCSASPVASTPSLLWDEDDGDTGVLEDSGMQSTPAYPPLPGMYSLPDLLTPLWMSSQTSLSKAQRRELI